MAAKKVTVLEEAELFTGRVGLELVLNQSEVLEPDEEQLMELQVDELVFKDGDESQNIEDASLVLSSYVQLKYEEIFCEETSDKLINYCGNLTLEYLKIARTVKTSFKLKDYIEELEAALEEKEINDSNMDGLEDFDNEHDFTQPPALIPVKKSHEKQRILTKKEEVSLAKRIERGDLEAKEILINRNMGLVIKEAYRYFISGFEKEDLIQEGTIGLIRATEKFDYRKNIKFSTYATIWIRQSLGVARRDKGLAMRMSARDVARVGKLHRITEEYYQENNREIDDETLAGKLGLDTPQLIDIKVAIATMASLDKPVVRGAKVTSVNFLEDKETNISDVILNNTNRENLEKAMELLEKNQRIFIQLSFGLGIPEAVQQKDIAYRYGLKPHQVSKLIQDGLKSLRNILHDEETLEINQDYVDLIERV